MKRPIFFSSFFSIHRKGSKFFTSPAILQSKSVVSKCVIVAHAALAGDEVLPAFLRADTQRADQSNARNDYPASQLSVLLVEG